MTRLVKDNAYDILLFVSRRGKVPYFEHFHSATSLRSCIAEHRAMRVPSAQFFPALFSNGISRVVEYKLLEEGPSAGNGLWRRACAFLKRIEASYIYSCYYRFFARHPSRFVAIWNGYKYRFAIAALVAKTLHREIVYFENGLLPGTTTMDFQGINAANSLPRDPRFYKTLHFSPDIVLPSKLVPRLASDKMVSAPQDQHVLPSPYIFIPFQVENDSQILVNSPWIRSMRQLFEVILRVQKAIGDVDLYFVFKEHPSSMKQYTDITSQLPNERIVFMNSANTQQLIEGAQAVVTINSTVGIEALLCNKKVILLGDACYGIEGLAQSASSENELIQCISRLDQWQIDESLRVNFLKYVYAVYSIPDSYRATTERHWQEIDARLLARIREDGTTVRQQEGLLSA